MTDMSVDMHVLARMGAQARLAELAAERDAIRNAFPDLGEVPPSKRGRPATTGTVASDQAEGQVAAKRGRQPMSAAAKKAVGERMKRYWQRRRASSTHEPEKAPEAEAEPTAKRTLSAEGRARISAAAKKRWRSLRKAKKAA